MQLGDGLLHCINQNGERWHPGQVTELFQGTLNKAVGFRFSTLASFEFTSAGKHCIYQFNRFKVFPLTGVAFTDLFNAI